MNRKKVLALFLGVAVLAGVSSERGGPAQAMAEVPTASWNQPLASPTRPTATAAQKGPSLSTGRRQDCTGTFELLHYNWSRKERSPLPSPLVALPALKQQPALPGGNKPVVPEQPDFVNQDDVLKLTARLNFIPDAAFSENEITERLHQIGQAGFLLPDNQFLPASLEALAPGERKEEAQEQTENQAAVASRERGRAADRSRCSYPIKLEAIIPVARLLPTPYSQLQWPLPEVKDWSGRSLIERTSLGLLEDTSIKSATYLPGFAGDLVSLFQVRVHNGSHQLPAPVNARPEKTETEYLLPDLAAVPDFVFVADRPLNWWGELVFNSGKKGTFEVSEQAIGDHFYYTLQPAALLDKAEPSSDISLETSFSSRFYIQDRSGQGAYFPFIKGHLKKIEELPLPAEKTKLPAPATASTGKQAAQSTVGLLSPLQLEESSIRGDRDGLVGPADRLEVELKLNRQADAISLKAGEHIFYPVEQIGPRYRFRLRGSELAATAAQAEGPLTLQLNWTDEAGRQSVTPVPGTDRVSLDLKPGTIEVNPRQPAFAKDPFTFKVTFSDNNLLPEGVDFQINGISTITAKDRQDMRGQKSWSKEITVESEGNYEFRAKLQDAAGNRTTWGEGIKLVVDRTAPQFFHATWIDQGLHSFRPGFLIQEHFRLAELHLDRLQCELAEGDSGSFVSWPLDRPILKEGKKTCRLVATDLAGNQSTALVFSFNIDGTPPVPVLFCGADGRSALPTGSPLVLPAGDFLHIGWTDTPAAWGGSSGRLPGSLRTEGQLPVELTDAKYELLTVSRQAGEQEVNRLDKLNLLVSSSNPVVVGAEGLATGLVYDRHLSQTQNSRQKFWTWAGVDQPMRCLIFTDPGTYELRMQGLDRAGNRSSIITYKLIVTAHPAAGRQWSGTGGELSKATGTERLQNLGLSPQVGRDMVSGSRLVLRPSLQTVLLITGLLLAVAGGATLVYFRIKRTGQSGRKNLPQ